MIRPEPCGSMHPGGGLRGEEEPADVDREQLVPLGLGRVDRVVVRPEPGVVDEDVEPAERVDDLRDRAFDRRPVGQIELDQGRPPRPQRGWR